MSLVWNPWHGCIKYSEGCLNCYVYRIDEKYERESREIKKNAHFDAPLKRSRDGRFKINSGETLYTCLSSDFFLEEADQWRRSAWEIMRLRPDVNFFIITKRILRFYEALPDDWGDGYDNVTIACTCENQKRADERLPFFLDLPIKHKEIVCEPLLESIDLMPYLNGKIECVSVGGESGDFDVVRGCDYAWITKIRDDCLRAHVGFHFHQTGARLIKDGRVYNIPRKHQHSQAKKAGIDTV